MPPGRCEMCGAPSATALCANCRSRLVSRTGGGATTAPAKAPLPAARASEAPAPQLPPGAVRRISEPLTGKAAAVSEEGSVVIDGKVGAGWSVFAGEDLTVTGAVERARIEAGIGAIQIEAPVREGDIRAGMMREPFRLLAGALEGSREAVEKVVNDAIAAQAGAAVRGETLTGGDAFRQALAQGSPDLEDRLARAASILDLEGERPELVEQLLTAIDYLLQAVTSGGDLGIIAGRSGDLDGMLETPRRALGAAPPSVVESLVGCKVACAGDLRIRGTGARDCEISVHGDLTVSGRGAALVGGTARVGGRLTAEKLGGAPTVVILEGKLGGRRVTATAVGSGVQVQVGEHSVDLPADGKDVTVSVERGRPFVDSRRR